MDIVERLRDYAKAEDLHPSEREGLILAADEIERLRVEVSEQCRLNGMGSEREAALMGENERLRKDCASHEMVIHGLHNLLVESQAREAKLRTELCNAWMDNMSPLEAEKRLSRRHPADDTALRERLRAERERCAETVEALHTWITKEAASAAIRALED